MTYEVIGETGSDTSYDLIIEAIVPAPPDGGVVVEALDDEQRERARMILASMGELVTHVQSVRKSGLRFRLFQRTPDPWVFAARLEALRAKLDAKAAA